MDVGTPRRSRLVAVPAKHSPRPCAQREQQPRGSADLRSVPPDEQVDHVTNRDFRTASAQPEAPNIVERNVRENPSDLSFLFHPEGPLLLPGMDEPIPMSEIPAMVAKQRAAIPDVTQRILAAL